MPQFKIKHSFTEYEYIKKLTQIDRFICFVMHRDFKSWCSALLSQQDSKIKIFQIKFNFFRKALFKVVIYKEISKRKKYLCY